MSISYRIYANTGTGDPVDYGAAIATVSSLTYSPPALSPGSDWTFAVRAFDTVTGLEESNIDARVRVVLDGSGHDVSATPATPTLLGLRAGPGGTCRVDWLSIPVDRPPATSFALYLTAGTSTTYGTPALTVSAVPGLVRYSATLSGLSDGAAYVVSVRAVNAAGDDGGTASLPAVGSASPPSAVDGLTAVATILPAR